MYIKIRDYNDPDAWHTYTKLKSLSFAPEVDFPSSTIPANEFVVEIVTTDEIPTMQEARLYDDMDALWAAYYVTEATRTSRKTVRVIAQSAIALMDKWTWGAEMIQNMSISNFVLKLFGRTSGSQIVQLPKAGTIYPWLWSIFEVDDSIKYDTITGFFPEQTARERLHWLCLFGFAFAYQFANTKIRIATFGLNSNVPLISISDTYSKPQYVHNTPVNAIYLRYATTFTTTDHSSDNQYSSSTDDNGVKWYYIKTEHVVGDRDAEGEGIVYADLTMNIGTTSALQWLLQSDRIELEVVNNGQYWPGQEVRIYYDEHTVYQGLIMSCDYTFGLQTKSKLVVHLRDATPLPTHHLTINYVYTDPQTGRTIRLGRKSLYLPTGEDYSIGNPAITMGGKQYTPDASTTWGTLTQDTIVNVAYTTTEPTIARVVAYIQSPASQSEIEYLECDESGNYYIAPLTPVSEVTRGTLTEDGNTTTIIWDVDKLYPGTYTLYAGARAEAGQRYFTGKITVNETEYNIYYNEDDAPTTRIKLAQFVKSKTGTITVEVYAQ